MPFLLFITTQITYKRFLILWAAVGLLLTSSIYLDTYYATCQRGIDIFGLIALICFFYSLLMNKSDFQIQISEYEILIVLYIVIAAFSGFFNLSTGALNFKVLASRIIRTAIPIGFGLSYIYSFKKKDLKLIIYGIAFYGLVNVLICYSVFLAGVFGVEAYFPISGLFNDRNGFVKYLSIVNVFFLIDFMLQKNNVRRFFYGILLIAIFFGILIQYSRSGYVVYFVSSTIVVFACGSKSAKKIALIILPMVLVLFANFTVARIHSEKMNIANASDLQRIYVLKSGINMIKAHPIKGVGYGMSQFLHREFADKTLPGLNNNMDVIHNWFVVVWAEIGIFGLIVFCTLNYRLMHKSIKSFYQSTYSEGKYSLFIFNAILIFMIEAFVQPIYDYENIYWIIVAIGVINLKDAKMPTKTLKA